LNNSDGIEEVPDEIEDVYKEVELLEELVGTEIVELDVDTGDVELVEVGVPVVKPVSNGANMFTYCIKSPFKFMSKTWNSGNGLR
jgi:hypothetical protein